MRCTRRIPWTTITAVVLAVTMMCLPQSLLLYVTLLPAAPLPIPLLFSHFAHWSWNHFVWDVSALCALSWLYESGMWRRVPGIGSKAALRVRSEPDSYFHFISFSAVFISACVCLFPRGIVEYRGLSGLCSAAYGLILFSALRDAIIEKNPRAFMIAVFYIILFSAKSAFELLTEATIFVDSSTEGFSVVPVAHLAGIMAGFLWVGSRYLLSHPYARDIQLLSSSEKKRSARVSGNDERQCPSRGF